MDKNNKLIKKILKFKKLQRVGNGLALVIPKVWLNAMDWSRDTHFLVGFNPIKQEIIINEEISHPESGIDQLRREVGESDVGSKE